MPMHDTPVSKVLVLDNSPAHAHLIKQFCDANNLVALKARKGAVMSVLRTNIDLGGILYSESYGESAQESARIALVGLVRCGWRGSRRMGRIGFGAAAWLVQ